MRPHPKLALTLALLLAPLAHAAPPAKQPLKTPPPDARKSSPANTIDGTQPTALDQPRIHLELRRTPAGQPLAPKLTAKDRASLQGLGMSDDAASIEAFLDTGASGLLLSANTASTLGIQPLPNATFEDVGVGGSERFNVSEPLYATLIADTKANNSAAPKDRPLPLRAQLAQTTGAVEAITGDLDVAGMPLLAGHIIRLDPSPVDQLKGTLNVTFLPTAPRTQYSIKLTPISFKRYTRSTPAQSGPTLADNPTIANVTLTHHGKTTTGTFLLDTGAAASMLSTKLAAQLGLPPNPKPDFSLSVGGVGGQVKSPGLYLDALSLPKGPTYAHAPLLIKDISLQDPKTHDQYTLDGVLGMNLFAGSANLTEGATPDIGNITPSPYKLIVIDLKSNTLGLTLK